MATSTVRETRAGPQRAAFAPTVVAFTAIAILATSQLYGVIPLLSAMGEAWHAPGTAMTWLVSSFGIGYATGGLLAGPFSDRRGRRHVVVAGLSASAVLTALIPLAPGPGVAIALRIVQGVATGVFAPVSTAYIGERLAPARRPVALTAVVGGFLGAAVFGQLAAQGIAAVAGWQGVFGCFAAALAASAVALWRVMLPDGPATQSTGLLAMYRPLPRLLIRRDLWPMYVAALVILGAFVAYYTGLELAGADAGRLLILRTAALPAVVALPFLTPALRRLPPMARGAASLGLAAIAVGAVAATDPGTVLLVVLLNLLTLGIGLASPALIEVIGDRGASVRGTALAAYTTFMFVGSSLGPQLATALTGDGDTTTLNLVLTGLLAGAALLVGCGGRLTTARTTGTESS